MTHRVTTVDGALIDTSHGTSNSPDDNIRVDGVFLPRMYDKFIDVVENFEVRDDDIWVCSFPKTGTTWTQEMVWCIANDLDFEGAKVLLTERFPFVEFSCVVNPAIGMPECLGDSINFVNKMPSPRFIKTHLPFNLTPRQLRTGEKKPKIVYVVRNAKDTCISYYHHNKIFSGLQGSFEEFSSLFLRDAVYSMPFWKHVLGFWNQKDNERLLILKYEDMKKDLSSVIKTTAKFLGKNLTTEQVSTLAEHLNFASMKVNPAVNCEQEINDMQKYADYKVEGSFMRSGTTGQWKTGMSPEVIKKFDDWIEENLKGTGLAF